MRTQLLIWALLLQSIGINSLSGAASNFETDVSDFEGFTYRGGVMTSPVPLRGHGSIQKLIIIRERFVSRAYSKELIKHNKKHPVRALFDVPDKNFLIPTARNIGWFFESEKEKYYPVVTESKATGADLDLIKQSYAIAALRMEVASLTGAPDSTDVFDPIAVIITENSTFFLIYYESPGFPTKEHTMPHYVLFEYSNKTKSFKRFYTPYSAYDISDSTFDLAKDLAKVLPLLVGI
mgnify:CR=1 FL=1